MVEGDIGIQELDSSPMPSDVIVAILAVHDHAGIKIADCFPGIFADQESGKVGILGKLDFIRRLGDSAHTGCALPGYKWEVALQQGPVEPGWEDGVVVGDQDMVAFSEQEPESFIPPISYSGIEADSFEKNSLIFCPFICSICGSIVDDEWFTADILFTYGIHALLRYIEAVVS